jgi:hypothetical protein
MLFNYGYTMKAPEVHYMLIACCLVDAAFCLLVVFVACFITPHPAVKIRCSNLRTLKIGGWVVQIIVFSLH